MNINNCYCNFDNTTGPRVKSFDFKSFPYNVDEKEKIIRIIGSV